MIYIAGLMHTYILVLFWLHNYKLKLLVLLKTLSIMRRRPLGRFFYINVFLLILSLAPTAIETLLVNMLILIIRNYHGSHHIDQL